METETFKKALKIRICDSETYRKILYEVKKIYEAKSKLLWDEFESL